MGTIEQLNEALDTNYRSFAKVEFWQIAMDNELSEDFIRKFAGRWNWLYIIRYQKLSEKFIKEFLPKLGMYLYDIIECQTISQGLRKQIEKLIKEREENERK